MKLEFSREIFEKSAELFQATEGRADMTNLIVAFRNFANLAKNLSSGRNGNPAVQAAELNAMWNLVSRTADGALRQFGMAFFTSKM
jgi:hypothetical protein